MTNLKNLELEQLEERIAPLTICITIPTPCGHDHHDDCSGGGEGGGQDPPRENPPPDDPK